MSSLERGVKLVPIVAEDAGLLHSDDEREESSFLSEDPVEVIPKCHQIENWPIKPMTLSKVLIPKSLNVDDEDWNEIQDKAVSIVTLYLKPNVLKQVEEMETMTTIFQALQTKYHMKELSNSLLISLKLMSFKMIEVTKIEYHIDAFNDLLVALLNLSEY
ncbi:hypothetical protein AXG93_4542s1130 [Marchantia polymorpha subsp. ruderalis]|uniref:Uncharacterized protein n=1 Tax=Marchantia polymorpha subsp. ruderalis TaxID=1480154 RepID=A0A176W2D6_MARPO|nr:hypothetical protein AXG93_4542s1130 [Marchantia polymorpha subsp. ruderalis]